jgi:iron complex transport system ATP-binding protein
MLSLRGVCAGYDDGDVLRGVDLDVAPGELVALAGPNGCGKTTLLRVITGIRRPASGAITVGQRDAASLAPAAIARSIAVVPQGASLPDRFSALAVVLMGRTPHLGMLRGESEADLDLVRAAMERTDCWRLRARYVDELSAGERQRVLIARALAQQPRVMLLDEPTSNLDLMHQVDAFLLLRELCRDDGIAVLAVVHDLTLAAGFADRIAVMHGGVIVADGAPVDVLRPALIERVFGTPVRVIAHPTTGRPVVVPDGGGERRSPAPPLRLLRVEEELRRQEIGA